MNILPFIKRKISFGKKLNTNVNFFAFNNSKKVFMAIAPIGKFLLIPFVGNPVQKLAWLYKLAKIPLEIFRDNHLFYSMLHVVFHCS